MRHILHLLIQDRPSWDEYDPARLQLLAGQPESFIEQPFCTISADRAFIEFPGTNHSAAGHLVGLIRADVKHNCQKAYLFLRLIADSGEFRLQFQSATAF